ncbi:GMC oxidoreductase [Streptomyces sp. Termitarium-T10T-6]|nr:GMC oxidoreductase [Streptomyces sp. Termitarium-T10T-6]
MSGTAHDLDDTTGGIPWDHLVVGAGSAGSVTAARLVSAGARVLLVEAGGEQPEGGPETNPLRDANRLILEGFNWDHRANLRSSTRWDELVGADGTSRTHPRERGAAAPCGPGSPTSWARSSAARPR